MKLSKTVPARTKTLIATWCRKDFTRMTENYRAIRGKCNYTGFNCYWCGHKFEDDEVMALACFVFKGNKVLCQECADKLIKSEAENG